MRRSVIFTDVRIVGLLVSNVSSGSPLPSTTGSKDPTASDVDDLLQKLDPLGEYIEPEECHSRDVAFGPRQIAYDPDPHGLRCREHNDWDRRRFLLQRPEK